MKRTIDLVLSLMLLVILSPILLVIAMVIRLKMGAPILFKQQRPGKNGQSFYLYKFRTMTMSSEDNNGPLSDADRLTALGQLLRKYSIDELPQLFNVLKGDMSLVGPRPLLKEYLPLYTPEQRLRHEVRPGITGWAQVNGRNAITWEEKFTLDTWYVKNQTFTLDIKILLLTIAKVFKKDGITQPGHVTTEKFTGSRKVI